MGECRLDISNSADTLLGDAMMKFSPVVIVLWMLIATVVARGQGQTGWSAQFFDPGGIEDQVVLIDFGAPFVYDPQTHLATLGDGSVKLDLITVSVLSMQTSSVAVLRADANPSGQYTATSYLNLALKNFTDQEGKRVSLNGSQLGSYLIILRGQTIGQKIGQTYTVNVSVQPKSAATITAPALAGPVRNQIVLDVRNADATAFFQALSKEMGAIKIEYDFGSDSTVSNIVTGVKKIDPPPALGFAVTLYPKTPLPYAAKAYKVNITLPQSALPKNLETTPKTQFKVIASATYPTPVIVETAATYDFEPSFTSAVNKSKNVRTNTGLFIVALNPLLFLHETGIDGSPSRYTHWYDFRPNISANVDTLPEKSSTTPNRVTIALDTELGLTRERNQTGAPREGGPPLDQWTWTNGVRTDTDRDFKKFSTYWHTDLAPDFWKLSETQAFRTRNVVSLGMAAKQAKTPFVTAYRLRPSVGYDLGSTTVRSGVFNPELGSSVSRFLFKLDTMLEIRRNVTFTAVDTGYYLFDATRRDARDFLDAQIAVNTGLLLRLDTNKIQSAVAFRYQRGSQPPSFTPVDTLSLGLKLYR